VPIAGADVEVHSAQGTTNLQTDANGRFSARLPIGSLSFIVSATGYETLQLSSLQVEALGLVVDAVLRPSAVPVRSITWGKVKEGYR
jgi:hypothetical protein